MNVPIFSSPRTLFIILKTSVPLRFGHAVLLVFYEIRLL